ncbi:MAG TPA: CZB domain-containing protein [Blastocatellia bacterium]|nr:CZB domain-containing protein [Blastocatellia bacterium]
MNFDEAIMAHKQWKARFLAFLKGQEQLDPSVVARDNVCALGQWIHRESAQHRSLPEFSELRIKHAHFHEVAAELVMKAVGMSVAEAQQMVGTGTNYSRASAECVNAIVALRKRLE